ncbi:MAG: transcription elongation factor GreA [Sulfuricurvum sp. PD_MW2]|jgi:transcription elongation factor GreA|uniref:transcription elongation factor GreA n=1 Tax=Sulfuricurvum sp. PD_MW2 TaxID=2027917 RepID=UPI000C0670BC|nr:transcription elongation factor GreA [Sulfuricurvum sp. PD_MW2]PHM16984.1 MAG: transcription elongation factor GreA [Sulfuricurvum sp. PD_MW2]
MNHKEPMSTRGYDELLREFKYLKEVEKPRVNQEKQRAAELGDRSENAEYHAAKEKLRHIDKRLFYLNSMIEKAQIIDPSLLEHSRAHFGATVTIMDVNSEEEFVYTICGTLESEPENALISVHSPLARAMLGKEEGDEFSVHLPAGKKSYEVIAVTYIDIYTLKKNIRTEKEFGFH